MITTRWKDCTENSFADIVGLLAVPPIDETNKGTTYYINWNVDKIFEDNQSIRLNGKEITFNYFKYHYDKILPGTEPIEDRTATYDGFVIPYFNGITTNYISSQNSNAQTILRRLLKYTGKNEIEKNVFLFDNDFFVWLISKVYTKENMIDSISDELHALSLDVIKGFKGDTDDLLTKVAANGESVMNIISTLSFLLESKNLHEITLDLKYDQHQNIELILVNRNKTKTISTDISKYIGCLEEGSKELVLPKLILLIYIEIIPILLQAYHSDIEDDLWGKDKNIDFLKSVAEDLSEKVRNKVEILEANCEQQVLVLN